LSTDSDQSKEIFEKIKSQGINSLSPEELKQILNPDQNLGSLLNEGTRVDSYQRPGSMLDGGTRVGMSSYGGGGGGGEGICICIGIVILIIIVIALLKFVLHVF
jgi:hypothetical protein